MEGDVSGALNKEGFAVFRRPYEEELSKLLKKHDMSLPAGDREVPWPIRYQVEILKKMFKARKAAASIGTVKPATLGKAAKRGVGPGG